MSSAGADTYSKTKKNLSAGAVPYSRTKKNLSKVLVLWSFLLYISFIEACGISRPSVYITPIPILFDLCFVQCSVSTACSMSFSPDWHDIPPDQYIIVPEEEKASRIFALGFIWFNGCR